VLEAAWLETTVFLNRGGRFEAVVLPGEAQFAPSFGVSVGDMDGDGHEDLFLSQNFSEWMRRPRGMTRTGVVWGRRGWSI
jgi:hypothetical protein